MSNKYEKLIKLYYKKKNIDEEYIKRIENPATLITELKINPMKKGNKILDKEYSLFYVNLLEFSLLQEKILQNSNKINYISNRLPTIDSLSSFRKIYDEMFEDFEKSANYKLDGKYFRKDIVRVINGLGNIIHIGVNGEEAIEKNIESLIEFINRKDIPFLVKASIVQFFFEYIHPFYDGNGRFGRYLLSLYLARKLDNLTAFSVSYSISRNLDDYYKSFVEVEDVNNYGEITFFVENILKTIKSGQEMIIELLNDSVMKFKHSMEILNELTKDLSEKENIILQIYLQNYLFNDFEEITNVELTSIIGDLTQQTINKYTQELEKKGYLVKIKQRPLTYALSEKITEKI